MKIVHVNTYDIIGGAARSAFRLHTGLRALGQDSSMFVHRAASGDPDVHAMEISSNPLTRAGRMIRRCSITRDYQPYIATRPTGVEPFQDCRSPFRTDFQRDLPSCDILNLHWIADSFLDFESFFARVPARTRIVWTLHDMNALTGGCHYDLGCGHFAKRCGRCPQLGSNDANDLAYQNWRRKADALSKLDPSRLRFVAPSRWLAEETGRSALMERFPVSVIPYGLNLDDFAPRDRSACREALGLPQDAKIVLFVADGLDNERKGFALLVAALAALPCDAPVTIVSVGRNKPDVGVTFPWFHFGSINNDRQLSELYSAADLFVIPSLQDNLPNTVLEAMACGTPTVGFAVGGIPDMARPGVTGMLVPPAGHRALGIAILELLRDPEALEQMGANCRRIAIEEYPMELQAARYAKLYETLMGGATGS